MSNYKGHVAGASVSAVLYLAALTFVFAIDILPQDRDLFIGYAFPIVLVGITVLFGLFPDVDINSHSQNVFFTIFFLVDVWLIWSNNYREAAYLGLISMLPILSKHRGWTHSRLAMVAVPLPFLILPALQHPAEVWVGMPYYGAAVVGYATHLLLDKELFS